MEALPSSLSNPTSSLQLLLFVDKRPSSTEKLRQILSRLRDLGSAFQFGLQVVDVGEHPDLVEHFKLVATPALVKIHPQPLHTLAGSDLIAQLNRTWTQWQQAAEDERETGAIAPTANANGSAMSSDTSIAHLSEVNQLSDEIFRLNQDKQALQEQLQFKERLIAMLAHDLRNPLTAVSIALETLEFALGRTGDRPSRLTPETTAQLLRHARTQAKALDRMITDALQAARGSTGKLQLQPQKLSISSLCYEVVSDLQNRFASKSQHITIDIPNDLPMVYVDLERIRQVITNLLDNACKYTPDQGTIAVYVLHRTTQKIQVSICDNGPGIPDKDKELIFEDRFRLERDEAKDGYGIGLALCQRIVRAHFGQIWVDSSGQQGSCFHFTLPVYQ